MNTILRKVLIQDRLPKSDNDYLTNLGWNRFRTNKSTDRKKHEVWQKLTDENDILKWWLEEVKLPTAEEINSLKNISHKAGALWYQDFVLAVTA